MVQTKNMPHWAKEARRFIKAKHTTDYWVAQMLEIHPSQFSRTLHGDPRYPLTDHIRRRLPLILGVEADDIFTEAELFGRE